MGFNSAFKWLRFPDFMTTAQDGGKFVSLTHRLPKEREVGGENRIAQRETHPRATFHTAHLTWHFVRQVCLYTSPPEDVNTSSC